MNNTTEFIRSLYLVSPKTIAVLLWNFSEASGISLGESDALVFGIAIGCSGMREVVEDESEHQG